MSKTSIGHVRVGPSTMKRTTCHSLTLPYTVVLIIYSYASFGVGSASIYLLSRFFYLRVLAYPTPSIIKSANAIPSATIAQ
jgi:hypothetical protein